MNNEKGFTFIELMVAVLILSLLVGKIVQTYYSITGPEARAETNISNLLVLDNAVKRYWLLEKEFPVSVNDLLAKGFLTRELESPYDDNRVYQLTSKGTPYLGSYETVSITSSQATFSKSADPASQFVLTVGFPPGRSVTDIAYGSVRLNHLLKPDVVLGNNFTFDLLPMAMNLPTGNNIDLILSGFFKDGVAFQGVVQVQVVD